MIAHVTEALSRYDINIAQNECDAGKSRRKSDYDYRS